MQLDILKRLNDGGKAGQVEMVMVGSCRGEEDYALVQGLKDYAQKIAVDHLVEF